MRMVTAFQADSGKVYASRDEAIADDEIEIQKDLNELVRLNDRGAYMIARYIIANFTRNEKPDENNRD